MNGTSPHVLSRAPLRAEGEAVKKGEGGASWRAELHVVSPPPPNLVPEMPADGLQDRRQHCRSAGLTEVYHDRSAQWRSGRQRVAETFLEHCASRGSWGWQPAVEVHGSSKQQCTKVGQLPTATIPSIGLSLSIEVQDDTPCT